MSNKIKIFVSSYACEPGKGSEIGVGWHWVLEMSKYFELWVLTRANNKGPIENYFKEHKEDEHGIHWIYYDCPDWIKKHKHQMKGVRTYYTLWQRLSNNLVKETMQKNNIEIYHLLTYGNAIWNVSSYGQKRFFIWGPTGGMDTIPLDYSKHYAFKYRIIEAVRRSVVWYQRKISISFRRKCKNANLIFCKAYSMYNAIPEKYRNKAILFTDVAMEEVNNTYNNTTDRTDINQLTYITVGRLDGWRGFDLLIEAFDGAMLINNNIKLKIIGEGIEEQHLKKMVKDKGLENNIIFTGQISMNEYRNEMKNCDVVLNACLKEGGVTNAFDCMTYGKPLICLDTGGYTRNFDDSCAIILTKENRAKTIKKIQDAIVKSFDSDLRVKLSDGMKQKGDKISWTIKGQDIRNEILKAWENNKK